MYRLMMAVLFGVAFSANDAAGEQPTFARNDFASSVGARTIVTADFDRNGLPDLAHANVGRNTVSIVLNHPGTGLAAAFEVSVGRGPFALASTDFNRDGIADLAVANADDDSITLLFGRGDGTFVRRTLTAKGNPRGIAAADINRDGIPDLIHTSYASSGVAAWVNDGTGAFTYQTSLSGYAPHPQGVVAADFNRDGQTDLAVACYSSSGLGLLYLENGSIAGVTPVPGAHNLNVLAAGDLNSDGWIDIVAVSTWRSRVAVYFNSPAGFSYSRSYATGGWPGDVAIVDVNQDGVLDITTANRTSNSVSVLIGSPVNRGSFVRAVEFPAGQGSRALAVADFNADGRTDLGTGNQYAAEVTVLSNATTFVRAAHTFHRESVGGPFLAGVASDMWTADFDRDGAMDVAVQGPTHDAKRARFCRTRGPASCADWSTARTGTSSGCGTAAGASQRARRQSPSCRRRKSCCDDSPGDTAIDLRKAGREEATDSDRR